MMDGFGHPSAYVFSDEFSGYGSWFPMLGVGHLASDDRYEPPRFGEQIYRMHTKRGWAGQRRQSAHLPTYVAIDSKYLKPETGRLRTLPEARVPS